MSTERFVRRPRREVPRVPVGEVGMQAPPEIPRSTPGNLLAKLLPVVMVAAMIGMVALMFGSGAARSPMSLVFPLMMVVSMVGMFAGSRGGGAKAAEADEDRKDYLRYLDRARAAGITAPIVPGIQPIHNFRQIANFAARCGTTIPAWLAERFDGLDDDPETHALVAAAVAAEQVTELVDEGVTEFHIYTHNRSPLALALGRVLGLRHETAVGHAA